MSTLLLLKRNEHKKRKRYEKQVTKEVDPKQAVGGKHTKPGGVNYRTQTYFCGEKGAAQGLQALLLNQSRVIEESEKLDERGTYKQ